MIVLVRSKKKELVLQASGVSYHPIVNRYFDCSIVYVITSDVIVMPAQLLALQSHYVSTVT